MKQIIYLITFLVLVGSVFADNVVIFNFNYDNGKLILKDQLIKEGYSPDKKIEVTGDYSCSIVDIQDQNIYSFNFDLPPKLFTDVLQSNTTVGGVITLSKTDFSVISPYSENAKQIVCYNPRGYEILRENVQKISLGPEQTNNWVWIYVIVALIGLIIIIYLNKRKK